MGDLKDLNRERCRKLEAAKTPPEGDSWVDYATRHQHVGAEPCWQCIARRKALAEVERLRGEAGVASDTIATVLGWAIESPTASSGVSHLSQVVSAATAVAETLVEARAEVERLRKTETVDIWTALGLTGDHVCALLADGTHSYAFDKERDADLLAEVLRQVRRQARKEADKAS